jgi:hypothetical protein
MLAQKVPHERLTPILVDSLQNFKGGSVAKTGEQSKEAASGLRDIVFKDDRVQLRGGGDATFVEHQPLGDGVDGVENDDLSDSSST